jgi:hypothetical protein
MAASDKMRVSASVGKIVPIWTIRVAPATYVGNQPPASHLDCKGYFPQWQTRQGADRISAPARNSARTASWRSWYAAWIGCVSSPCFDAARAPSVSL